MTPRSFPVPVGARSGLLGATATFDQIDLAATLGNRWAAKILARENARILASVLGGDQRLPFGICTEIDDDLYVTALVRGGECFTAAGWLPVDDPVEEPFTLDADEVAFVARAFAEGYDTVIMKGYTPVAMLATSVPAPGTDAPAPVADLPEGAKVLAVVDDGDRNAVLDVIAVAPGPHVYRRHDGKWQEDVSFIARLRSVKPPPVVALDDAQIASVLPQVDEQTKGLPFSKEPPKKATTASAFSARADEMAIEFALLAAAKDQLKRRPGGPAGKALSQATPGGRMPHELMTYWSVGEGGTAKIRWGTPGAWRRCHRQLTKYVGPLIAKGLCTNIGKRRGGKGVAWDVG